jgi:hypothetical protein
LTGCARAVIARKEIVGAGCGHAHGKAQPLSIGATAPSGGHCGPVQEQAPELSRQISRLTCAVQFDIFLNARQQFETLFIDIGYWE